MDVLEHPVLRGPVIAEPDEAAARRTLRGQVSRLERDLGAAVCAAYPSVRPPAAAHSRRGGPRVLGLGELEALRDDLAERVRLVQGELAAQAERQDAKRRLVEEMLLEPARHRWVRVSNTDIGERGCRHWHARPRLGLIGMLAGWWHVKLSSGCPLPGGSRRTPRPRPAGADGPALA